MVRFILFFLVSNFVFSQSYYVYVASESDDTVSLLKFENNEISEVERIIVGTYPTEIEGPHGITVDPNGKFWYHFGSFRHIADPRPPRSSKWAVSVAFV